MLKCNCGGLITEIKKDISWNENGEEFTILGVPTLICPDCEDELYPSNVQFSLSCIADEIREKVIKRCRYSSLI